MSTCNADKSGGGFDRPKPFVVPIFLPHRGCSHRCVFCNQHAVADGGDRCVSPRNLPALIERWLGYGGYRRTHTQISFFGGNFLGLRPDGVAAYLAAATRFVVDRRVDGIRFSTRPDTIDGRALDLIADYPVHTIELGVQSMDDGVLQRCRRGHTAAHTASAVDHLKQRGYEIGLQLMIGLPGQDWLSMVRTAHAVAALKPDFVRIYPTLVLAGSRLASWHASKRYLPLEFERALDWVKKLFLYFRGHGIVVARMGLQATKNLDDGQNVLAGPYHSAFGHLVHSVLFLDMARLLLNQKRHLWDAVTFRVHPHSIPKIRGLKNSNIAALQKAYGLRTVDVIPDPLLPYEGLQLAELETRVTYDNLRCDI